MKGASVLRTTALAILAGVSQAADKSSFSIESTDSIKSTASTLAHDLLQYYKGNETGETPGLLPEGLPFKDDDAFYWYESGLMWQILIDYAHYTGDTKYNNLIMQGLLSQAGKGKDFMPLNQTAALANDDQALWGLAALLAAERDFPNPPADQPQWLALAKSVFDTMVPERWDDETCDGGLRWAIAPINGGYHYKNIMSNGGLFALASRLAHFTGNKTYADWADKTWNWLEDVNFIDNETYAVYDGADVAENCTKVNIIQLSWSNALLTHGAAYMYNYTNADSKWEDRVNKLVKSGLDTFFKNDAVFEPAYKGIEDDAPPDGITYKGVFHQWYAATTQVASFTADMIRPALKKSAKAAIDQCTGGDDSRQCGSSWHTGKYSGTTGARQEMAVLAAVSSLLVGDSAGPGTVNNTRSPKGGSGDDSGDDSDKAGGSADGKKGNGTDGKDESGDSAGFRAGANAWAVVTLSIAVAGLSSIAL